MTILAERYKLKPKEARFVEAYVRLGSQKAAALEMGISNQLASYYYNKENVNEAIWKQMEWVLPDYAVKGLSVLMEIVENPDEATSDRISAAKELTKQGMEPLKKPKQVEHRHQIEYSTAELLARAQELQKELGNVTDAEFEEVEGPEEAERSSHRLARLPFKAS